jgi:hypothetical protein
MPLSSAPAGQHTVPRGWLLAGLVALSYFCTSLVVVLNALGNATGVVCLSSFPTGLTASAAGSTGRFRATSPSERHGERTHGQGAQYLDS